MPILTALQIAEYAKGAGLSGEPLAYSVAIALGESGGNSDAIGDTTIQTSIWGPSIGLWQIRSLKADYGTGKVRDASRLKDPAFNAKSMFSISNGGLNWGPWTVYKNGSYLRYLSIAREAVKALGESASSSTSSATIVSNAANINFDSRTLYYAGFLVAGGILIIIAMIQFSGNADTVAGAGKLVADLVLTKGKGTITKAVKAVS